MKKSLNSNEKLVFGTKFSGKHKKKVGPKEQREKKYKGQGR